MIANLAGVGLRQPHYQQVLAEKPDINWFEVHSENFFYLDSIDAQLLSQIREHYPISMHGVGLSLGSATGVNSQHLAQLKQVIDHFEPVFISEHLSWSRVANQHLPDLLPLPYTKESLDNFCANVMCTQDYLGRQILIENPSSYISFKAADMSEWEFYAQVPKRTGCGLLLDINNVIVNAHNHHFDAIHYLNAVDAEDVKEIHLAGATTKVVDGSKTIMIDDHGSDVDEPVWDLYQEALKRFGNKPTLIERDTNIPALSVLMAQANRAQHYLNDNHG